MQGERHTDFGAFEELVKEELGAKGLLDEKGRVLYSSVYSIRKWPIGVYVLGLDPGGSPEEHKTIREDIGQREMRVRGYSALRDERWRKHAPGTLPYALHALQALQLLGYDIESDEIPVSNAIFSAQRDAINLRHHPRIADFKVACWGVHMKLLEIIQPKSILCLGVDENLSSWSLVKKWSNHTFRQIDVEGEKEKQTASGGKFGSVQFSFLDKRTILIGIKHPSRMRGKDLPEKMRDRLVTARKLGLGKLNPKTSWN